MGRVNQAKVRENHAKVCVNQDKVRENEAKVRMNQAKVCVGARLKSELN